MSDITLSLLSYLFFTMILFLLTWLIYSVGESEGFFGYPATCKTKQDLLGRVLYFLAGPLIVAGHIVIGLPVNLIKWYISLPDAPKKEEPPQKTGRRKL